MTFSPTSQSQLDRILSPPPSPASLAPSPPAVLPQDSACLCAHTRLVSKHSVEISRKDWDAAAAKSQWPMRGPDCLCIAAERGLDILSARQSEGWQRQTMRHFLFAFLWLLISVSDSADVGEIWSHWVGCAPFFFSLTLSFSQSPFPPLSPASPSAGHRPPSLLGAPGCLSWSQIC